MALTDKQRRFVSEYLVDLNATQAAIRAGYSEKAARAIGSENLTKPDIQKAIQKARTRQQSRVEVTADDILRELISVGMSKAGDEQDSHLKFNNKLRALELAGKHLGMFDKKADTADTTGSNLVDVLTEGTGEDVDTDDLPEVE